MVPKRCVDAVVRVVGALPALLPCARLALQILGAMSAAESESHAGLAEAERLLWGCVVALMAEGTDAWQMAGRVAAMFLLI